MSPTETRAPATVECGPLLDAIQEQMRTRSPAAALEQLQAGLAVLRRKTSAEGWGHVIAAAREHPLREILHLDPFMLRAYSKPRGRPGDAVALDYILRARELAVRPKDRTAEIHHGMTQGAFARALRFRRDTIARVLDESAAKASRPMRAFCAGAGHLRELDRTAAFAGGRIERLVAYDDDPENLEVVRRDYGQHPVLAQAGSLRSLVDGRHLHGDMDLAYCTGWLDTLPQSSAQALTRALFAMLRPGGTLLLACFTPKLPEAAMMEVYMDWRMVLRTEAEIFDLVKPLEPEAVNGWSYSENPESTMGFVSVTRR